MSSKANGVRNDRYPVTELREGHNTPADTPTYSRHPVSHDVPSNETPSISPSPSSSSVPVYRYPYSPVAQSTMPQPSPRDTPLPSIAALTGPYVPLPGVPTPHASHHVHLHHPSPSNYSPLSTEDKRVLSSFRVVL